jgi:hypothetical protein
MYDKKTLEEINLLKQSLLAIERNCSAIGDWLPKKSVMRFFGYEATQLRELEKENSLVVSKIKARRFYSVQSIINLIEKNIIEKK